MIVFSSKEFERDDNMPVVARRGVAGDRLGVCERVIFFAEDLNLNGIGTIF